MSPPCKSFPASQLPHYVQVDVNGKRRKTEGGRKIDLARDCELLSLVQYDCKVVEPEVRNSPVQCWPVQRWFRRCRDLRGTFMVETTAWEDGATQHNSTREMASVQSENGAHGSLDERKVLAKAKS